MGFRCNPLSIQTCPLNSSFTDQRSPSVSIYLKTKTTTKASTLCQNTAYYEKIERQYSILLIIFTESLHLSEALCLKPCLSEPSCPQSFSSAGFSDGTLSCLLIDRLFAAHRPIIPQQSWRVALTPGGTLHSNSGEEGARGTDALLFRGEEERHINHPKTSVLSAALEFCQSDPDFPPITVQKKKKRQKKRKRKRWWKKPKFVIFLPRTYWVKC